MGSVTFKPEVSLGIVIQIAIIVCSVLAFLFKKYWNNEGDALRIDKHNELIEALTKAQTEMIMNQGKQQTLIDQLEKANAARDRRLDMIEDYVYRGGQYNARREERK